MIETTIIAIIYMFMLLVLLIPMLFESKKSKIRNNVTTYFLPEIKQYIDKIKNINNDERDIIINKILQHNEIMNKEYSKCDTATKYTYLCYNSNLQTIFNYIDHLDKLNFRKN
jgi:hypothetical protein